jgi:regulation of enolase protein 1 (concanavalin A-like superfamily)
MENVHLYETFEAPDIDPRLKWFCPPVRWAVRGSHLALEPDAKTDFWQRTHYGFRNDTGHFLYLEVEGDFILSTRVRFYPAHQYDQAGLMVRLSEKCWLKTSVEYEPEGPANLGVVVTNRGYSDWSTQPFPEDQRCLELRVTRQGSDYLVHCREAEGQPWVQMRVAHLDHPSEAGVWCGLYACSPIDAGFRAEFEEIKVEVPG